MRIRVKLPERYEEKRSLDEYLSDSVNGEFNRACYEVMTEFYDNKKITDELSGLREEYILNNFNLAYGVAINVKRTGVSDGWGKVLRDGNRLLYRMPDGSDVEKLVNGPGGLTLVMGMLCNMLRLAVNMHSDIRNTLPVHIHMKFSGDDEYLVFDYFAEKLGCRQKTFFSHEVVKKAVVSISHEIIPFHWKAVVSVLRELEEAGRYKTLQKRVRKGDIKKHLALDIAEYLGYDSEKEKKLSNNVKCAKGEYIEVENRFKLLLGM